MRAIDHINKAMQILARDAYPGDDEILAKAKVLFAASEVGSSWSQAPKAMREEYIELAERHLGKARQDLSNRSQKRAGDGSKGDVSFESGLKDDEPRIVEGVKGMQSKRFSKRFPNAAAMERWLDGEGGDGDYEVQTIKRA